MFKVMKMELFAKIVNGFQPLTIFAKSFILNVWRRFGVFIVKFEHI